MKTRIAVIGLIVVVVCVVAFRHHRYLAQPSKYLPVENESTPPLLQPNESKQQSDEARNADEAPDSRQAHVKVQTMNQLSPDLGKAADSSSFNWNKISQEQAANAVDALYNAILWRKPDATGGAKAVNAFTGAGWPSFVGAAQGMITSREFANRIGAKHSTQSIIHRMYAVFLNRCANSTELREHFKALKENDPGQIPTAILTQAKNADDEKIFSGGHDPVSCPLVK